MYNVRSGYTENPHTRLTTTTRNTVQWPHRTAKSLTQHVVWGQLLGARGLQKPDGGLRQRRIVCDDWRLTAHCTLDTQQQKQQSAAKDIFYLQFLLAHTHTHTMANVFGILVYILLYMDIHAIRRSGRCCARETLWMPIEWPRYAKFTRIINCTLYWFKIGDIQTRAYTMEI